MNSRPVSAKTGQPRRSSTPGCARYMQTRDDEDLAIEQLRSPAVATAPRPLATTSTRRQTPWDPWKPQPSA